MGSLKNQIPTYQDYLHQLAHNPALGPLGQTGYYDQIAVAEKALRYTAHVPYLLDYTNSRYAFFGQNSLDVIGHAADAFYEGNLAFTLAIWHPRDVLILNRHVFPDNLRLFQRNHRADLRAYRISYNYRVQHARTTKWIQIRQQSTVLQATADGQPLVVTGVASDITPYKNDSRISHLIEQVMPTGEWSIVWQKHYFPDMDQEELLTERETEILKWVLDGRSSQWIAQHLNLSFHTVRTHRKHLLEKTNAHNTADLLRFGLEKGLL